MKKSAHILKYKGKVLKTAADVSAVNEALWRDLIAGDITLSEFRKIEKDVKRVIDRFRSALRTAGVKLTLDSLIGKD